MDLTPLVSSISFEMLYNYATDSKLRIPSNCPLSYRFDNTRFFTSTYTVMVPGTVKRGSENEILVLCSFYIHYIENQIFFIS